MGTYYCELASGGRSGTRLDLFKCSKLDQKGAEGTINVFFLGT